MPGKSKKKKKTAGNYWKEKRERDFSHENFPQMSKSGVLKKKKLTERK